MRALSSWKLSLIALLTTGLFLGFTSCSRNLRNDLVKESYVHKYGVPVTKNEWEKQGEEGQVVQVLKDGTTIVRSYQKKVLHGPTTKTFPLSSTIQTVEQYDQGTLTSVTNHYFTGVPKEEEKFHNGVLVQKRAWYEDGVPALIEHYENGFLTTGEYLTELNTVESRVQEGQGVRLVHGYEGTLLFKDLIHNGQMVERVSYFITGEPSSITHYEDNLMHGQRLTFLAGGLPNTVEEWVHGRQEGITTLYQNGEKIAEVPYIRGKKQGIELKFRDGKEVIGEITWVDDVQHGPCKISIDGVEKTDWYYLGTQVSRNTYERMNIR
jgi:antitoxin component YwqK of YwqJK toxin-antitoxin module